MAYNITTTRTPDGWRVVIDLIGNAKYETRAVYEETFNGYTHSEEMAVAAAKEHYVATVTEAVKRA